MARILNRIATETVPQKRRLTGFTLIELLVVIAICIILIAFSVGAFRKAISSAHIAKCSKNLQQIGMASTQYAIDHSGNYPEIWRPGEMVWNDRLNEYFELSAFPKQRFYDAPVWWCPDAKMISKYNRHYGLNYQIVNTNWNFHRLAPPQPSRIILVGEMNENIEMVVGFDQPEQTGRAPSRYRTSHNNGEGANYLFCDGHVEYLHGALSDLSAETSRWKWW